jgi:AcrR family transcriptional regulator
MPKNSKKRTRLSAEVRKEAIVAAAIEIVAEKGFLETSFQMIADRCKVSQSAVLHHFKNKEELVEAVMAQLLKHNHELVSGLMLPEDDAKTRLIKHFRGNIQWAVKYEPEGQLLLLLYYFASYHPHFSKIYAEILKNARIRIKAHILAAIREKIFKDDINADEVSGIMHDALLGSFINYVTVRKSGEEPEDPIPKWERLIKNYEVG